MNKSQREKKKSMPLNTIKIRGIWDLCRRFSYQVLGYLGCGICLGYLGSVTPNNHPYIHKDRQIPSHGIRGLIKKAAKFLDSSLYLTGTKPLLPSLCKSHPIPLRSWSLLPVLSVTAVDSTPAIRALFALIAKEQVSTPYLSSPRVLSAPAFSAEETQTTLVCLSIVLIAGIVHCKTWLI